MKSPDSLLPLNYLFRYELDAQYSDVASIDGWMELTNRYVIPCFQELGGPPRIANIRFARGDDSLFFAADLLSAGMEWLRKFDGIHHPLFAWNLFIDTRPSDNNRRGTRYCHWIRIEVPTLGSKEISIQQCPMRAAREQPHGIDVESISRRWSIRPNAMTLGVAIPFHLLTGFEVEDFPVIGFFYELAMRYPDFQVLALESHCRFDEDPSLWSRVRLGSPPTSKRNRRS